MPRVRLYQGSLRTPAPGAGTNARVRVYQGSLNGEKNKKVRVYQGFLSGPVPAGHVRVYQGGLRADNAAANTAAMYAVVGGVWVPVHLEVPDGDSWEVLT